MNGTKQRGLHLLSPATSKCCDTDDCHPEAHDLRPVQAMSAPSKGNNQAIPTRPVHRKQQAAEKYEQRAEISQHRVRGQNTSRMRYGIHSRLSR
jgi:hypothetical protein